MHHILQDLCFFGAFVALIVTGVAFKRAMSITAGAEKPSTFGDLFKDFQGVKKYVIVFVIMVSINYAVVKPTSDPNQTNSTNKTTLIVNTQPNNVEQGSSPVSSTPPDQVDEQWKRFTHTRNTDAFSDEDDDTLDNYTEFTLGTDPLLAHTRNPFFSDAQLVEQGPNPLVFINYTPNEPINQYNKIAIVRV